MLNFWTDNEVAMRRFYFHLRAGDELVPDEEGIDLPDLSAARREAIEAVRELWPKRSRTVGRKFRRLS